MGRKRPIQTRSDTLSLRELGAIVAVRQIGWMEASAMKRFGYTYEEARAWIQAKRRKAGRLRKHKPSPRLKR